ncbi:protein kinase domain-containing protein [Urbifossiella limnaea]|uniref:Serine/threonine-protein kinase PknB n=1 Tax=Urbifossiella limnaea TaxID=2528023 RepID=A0A517XR63_9BACT|nr:family 16 glycoside hydrolase [Urbifossiella limnaea]QDU19996.1 Serine/threonine-protein kinase PknB [Urbifossiella limnaea]
MPTPHDPGSDQPEPDPLPPSLVAYSDYEVLRRLGRGGMGVVYLARNLLMGRLEALKLQADPGPGTEFLREVQAAARLAHPNIVAVYSARVVLGTLVLAMEYIDGCDLGRLVARRGRLPVPSACELARQAAVGLQYAHDAGVIHRDIKPSNLILAQASGPAVLKILDFGIARADGVAEGAVSIGTPAFAAPEQFENPSASDARSDIYALGGTLFYMLTGGPPFSAGTVTELMQCHREGPPPRLESVRPGVPSGLARLVERMLAKNPADRPQTAGEVARAIVAFVEPDAPTWELAAPPPAGNSLVTLPPTTSDKDSTIPLIPTVPTVIPTVPVGSASAGRPKRVWLASAVGIVLAVGIYAGCASWPRPGTITTPTARSGDSSRPVVGPVQLFDGQSLAGWVVDGGDPGEWKVEDGVITATGIPKGPRTWLLTEKEYGDFRVRFDYRLEAGANSGFAFRAVPGERPVLTPGGRPWPVPHHQQIEISDDRAKRWANLPTGQVNGGGSIGGPALKPTHKPPVEGEWNRMEVELRGQAIRVRVNGEDLLVDNLEYLVRAGSLFPALFRTRGRIGFQQYEHKADFRNVTIEEFLPPNP